MGKDAPVGDESLIADVAPLNSPDGNLDGADVLILMRAILGQVTLPEVETGISIADFNPKSAPVGTLITITGSGFGAGATPQVTLQRQGGGTIPAPVASRDANTIDFTIPTAAATGLLTVTVNGNEETSAVDLTIVASSDFSLTAGPASADVIDGFTTTYAITLNSVTGFSQLAALSVTGLPAGVTAEFSPAQIAAGNTSLLTISAPPGQATGSSALTISATATVDGIALQDDAGVTLNVTAVTTTFMGRAVIDDAEQTPLEGVTITFLGVDGAGNSTGCTGTTTSDAAATLTLPTCRPNAPARS